MVKRNLQFLSPLQRLGSEVSSVISGVTSPSLETQSLPESPPQHKLREGRKGLTKDTPGGFRSSVARTEDKDQTHTYIFVISRGAYPEFIYGLASVVLSSSRGHVIIIY